MDRKIGIVGVGIMGHGIATNFLKHGYTLFVWNRTAYAADDLVKLGATFCATPADVARSADITFEVTANDESSRAVWTGKDGILAGADTKKIFIASATLSISWVDALIAMCAASGLTFLDVTLTGGRIGAESGTLTLLCGGPDAVIENLAPVFGAIAKNVHSFGPVGSGARYKLILNFMQALHIVGFGQAMKIAKARNMDLKKVSDALVEKPGGSITAIAQRTYFTDPDPITFSIEWIVKDLTYARKFASGLNITLLDEVLKVYEQAKEKGFAGKDWARISQLLE